MEFNIKLMQLRKERGWSQEQLGEQINVTRQTVSKWELGETTPELKKLLELSKLFEISIDELTGNDSFKQTHSQDPDPYAGRFHYRNNISYEYISKRKLFNIPLVHINFGGIKTKAKGIIAIGNTATGLIAVGFVAFGGISIGFLSLGLISLGFLSVALLLSLGGISIGAVAVGGISLGLLSMGGLSIGMYSLGGCAIAQNIAVGGYADAIVAIGDVVSGDVVFHNNSLVYEDEIKTAITQKLPNTPKFIADLFAKLGKTVLESSNRLH